MTTDVSAERQAVLVEARRYIGTPYFHMGLQRLAGVDCVTFLYLAFFGAKLIEPITFEYYPADWHFHKDVERYMGGLLAYCDEMAPADVSTPEPGDIVLFRYGRAFSHGALVEEWPTVLHARNGRGGSKGGVERTNVSLDGDLLWITERIGDQGKRRPMRVFRFKGWAT